MNIVWQGYTFSEWWVVWLIAIFLGREIKCKTSQEEITVVLTINFQVTFKRILDSCLAFIRWSYQWCHTLQVFPVRRGCVVWWNGHEVENMVSRRWLLPSDFNWPYQRWCFHKYLIMFSALKKFLIFSQKKAFLMFPEMEPSFF